MNVRSHGFVFPSESVCTINLPEFEYAVVAQKSRVVAAVVVFIFQEK
jgi:hypothetical protein